jgi:hypothetical protein
MPSHLTRLVFRSIVANEPLIHPGCRLRAVRPHLVNRTTRALPSIQRRTFFDQLFKQRRKLKPVQIPAGFETLSEVVYNIQTAVRPPQPKLVVDAFIAFFTQRKGAFEDFHIAKAHRAFKYLLENPREDGQPWLSAEQLRTKIFLPLVSPAHRPESDPEDHVKFGSTLLEEYRRLLENTPAEESTKPPPANEVESRMVHLLSVFGAAREARKIAEEVFRFHPELSEEQRQLSRKVWGMVLGGIVWEADIDQVRKTAELFKSVPVPVTARMQSDLVTFFCKRNEMEDAKFWYEYPVVDADGKEGARPTPRTYAVLLKACAAQSDLVFGQQVVASLLKNEMPEKGAWDAIFLWSAAIGKGVDEVDRMMNVMIRRNDEARQKDPSVELIRPDVVTMNTLVEFAMSKQDPYTAERYIVLGEKRGIMPDEMTYAMQIQYRLSVKDIDGARAAYYNLQGEFSGAEQSVKVINQLIRALCESQQHHFDEVMVMVDDLHERKAHFDPQTVAALCVLHLRRGEAHDAADLLQVHAHQYSPEQRGHMRNGLVAFILNGETSTADAWETYQILRNVFSETSREDRIRIMNGFFSRKRSDMACHVFFHMRDHVSEDHNATADVYVAAFVGFARCADAESLELAHNQLKLDMNVNMDTRLRNALMLAYGATEENIKAMRFWREICESKEGPSYNSIAIAFRACETMHHGYGHARSIWKRLKEQDVEIDKTIWKAYMCAMARNFQHDDAQTLIETVEEEYGFKLDLDM